MGRFRIENYIVETVHEGKDEILHYYQRFIILECPRLDDGVIQQAVFIFQKDEYLWPDRAGVFNGARAQTSRTAGTPQRMSCLARKAQFPVVRKEDAPGVAFCPQSQKVLQFR